MSQVKWAYLIFVIAFSSLQISLSLSSISCHDKTHFIMTESELPLDIDQDLISTHFDYSLYFPLYLELLLTPYIGWSSSFWFFNLHPTTGPPEVKIHV